MEHLKSKPIDISAGLKVTQQTVSFRLTLQRCLVDNSARPLKVIHLENIQQG